MISWMKKKVILSTSLHLSIDLILAANLFIEKKIVGRLCIAFFYFLL